MAAAFQSPSLRGSGRFSGSRPRRLIGFTFQSPSLRGSGRFLARNRADAEKLRKFQSPSLRGSGRFPQAGGRSRARRMVSIPFIAGQWSLRLHCQGFQDQITPRFQSPSLRGSGRFAFIVKAFKTRSRLGFNPLHCGAVVASGRRNSRDYASGVVFQSPSLRGSGRFRHPRRTRAPPRAFQSPSLRGSGRFRARAQARAKKEIEFQSPSLRGSGRFAVAQTVDEKTLVEFQSPSLRGSGRFSRRSLGSGLGPSFNPLHCGAVVASPSPQRFGERPRLVSIPFIAGQWSLPPSPPSPHGGVRVSIPFIAGQWSLPSGSGTSSGTNRTCFNPLHCGAVVASPALEPERAKRLEFQSPSLRGSGRFTRCMTSSGFRDCATFQSPSLRGSGRFSLLGIRSTGP